MSAKFIVGLVVAACFCWAPASASAGLFGHRHADCGCDVAPSCCEVVVSCEPACDPCARGGKLRGLLSKFGRKSSCCEPAPSCCEPAPCCTPAPVCCEPAPVCCEPAPAPVCCEPAPVCCDSAPVCCDSAPVCCDKGPGLFAKLRARCAARKASCCEVPSCGCESAPSCGCGCGM